MPGEDTGSSGAAPPPIRYPSSVSADVNIALGPAAVHTPNINRCGKVTNRAPAVNHRFGG